MQSVNTNSQRKAWIDALRAMAILMVLYGHHAGCAEFFAFANPVKMPIFFALSGYLFKIKPGGDKAFFKKTFTGIVVPWLVLGVLPIALSFPINGIEHAMNSLMEVLSGGILWFLPCFIVSQIVFYYFVKWSKGKTILLVAFCIIASVIGHILRNNGILTFFMINIALTVQIYFLFGHLFRKHESQLQPLSKKVGIPLFLAYILIGILLFPMSKMDVHNAKYICMPIGLSMAFIGLTALFMLAPLLKSYPHWVSLVGRNTLVIYIMERYAIIPIEIFFDFHHNPYWMIALATLFFMVWTCLISIALSKFLHRYAPWVTGGRY